jgi:hypothetical protein
VTRTLAKIAPLCSLKGVRRVISIAVGEVINKKEYLSFLDAGLPCWMMRVSETRCSNNNGSNHFERK